jgi:hypothetical protein
MFIKPEFKFFKNGLCISICEPVAEPTIKKLKTTSLIKKNTM